MCDLKKESILKEQEEFHLYDVYRVEPPYKNIDKPSTVLYDDGIIREVPTIGTETLTDEKSDKTTDQHNDEVK